MHPRDIVSSIDWILLGITLLLVSLGLAMLFSSTAADTLATSRFYRQLISLIISLAVFIVITFFPYHRLRRLALPLYVVGLISLIIVANLGTVIRGTTSRLEFIGTQIQPSEFMKIGLIITIAWLLSIKLGRSRQLIIMTVASFAASGLVALEPDIGTAALMIGVWLGVIIYAGVKWRNLALISVAGAASLAIAWRWIFAPYQKERLITFLDPANDPLGAGYHVVQSIVALGSGGFLGRGLGHGPQSQLKFLPEQHTDFIFASIGEELGFVGIALVISLYGLLLWRILNISQSTQDPFGRYLAVGTFLLLLISFVVSAGMNMGLLPVTGIPLPLLSYGGSNLLSTFILLAIVQSIHVYSTWVRKPPAELSEFT